MRIPLALLAVLGCSHPSIGPDDASTKDASTADVGVDGAAPDADGDGSSAPGDFSKSGSRIRVLTVTGSDGSQSIAPFLLDTQTGCFCSWNPLDTSGTQWRCAPLGGCDGGAQSTWATGTGGSL